MPISVRAWRLLSGSLALLLTVVLFPVTTASAATSNYTDTSPARTWSTNGRVSAILPVGNRIYIGGTFTAVTDPSGNTYPVRNAAVFLRSTGAFDLSWRPDPNAAVAALAASQGKIYLGGDFTQVGGVGRERLAAVNETTGSLDSSWQPDVNNHVASLEVSAGMVYVGGLFARVTDSLGSHDRSYLARLRVSDGTLDANWAPVPDAQVRAVALSDDGSRVYVGGDFLAISGRSATHVASVDTSTGALTAGFTSGPTNGTTRPPALDLEVDSGHLIVAAAGGGGGCASLNATSGRTEWSYHSNGNMQAVTVTGGTVFCGGHFDGTGGFGNQERYKLATVDEATGALLPFAPRINSALGIWAMASDAQYAYAGGDFTKISGVTQQGLAQFYPDSTQSVSAAAPNFDARAGDGKVQLLWDVPWTDGGASINYYWVYRAVEGGTLTRLTKATTSSWQDTTVTNGTTYRYAVSAINSVGESPLSAVDTAQPGGGAISPPTAPRALSAANADGAAQLAWQPPADDGQSPVTSYRILRGTSSGAEQQIATVNGTSTSYLDSAVTLGQTYYYQVVAVNAAGSGPPSSEVSITITVVKPDAPVLSATTSGGRVVLSWTLPASGTYPIKNYTLLRDSVQYAKILVPNRTYTDSNVTVGATYVYQVRATSQAGNSPLSNKVTVTVR